MGSGCTFRLILCAGITALAAAGASAQAPVAPPDPAPLSSLVKNLDAPDVQTRIKAAESIYFNDTISLAQIQDALRAEDLSAEQRRRLLGVGYQRFVNSPRGALGVTNTGNLGTHGVVLASVRPDFPAGKVLRAGDRITAGGGETIDTWERMRAVILSHDPGDEIPITVIREGATLNLKIRLGSFSGFRPPEPRPDDRFFIEGWRLRSKSFRGPEPAPPVESGLAITAWASPYGALADEPLEAPVLAGRPDADDARVAVVAGGEPKGGLAPAPELFLARNPIRQFNPPQDAAQAIQAQIDITRSSQDILNQRISNNKSLLADPKTTAAERRNLEEENRLLELQVAKQSETLRALRVQLGQLRAR